MNLKASSINEKQLKEMLGKCQFETNEKRTSSNTFTAVLSRVVQKINNIRLIDDKSNLKDLIVEDSETSKQALEKLIIEFFNTYKLSYANIRKITNIEDNLKFKDLDYKKILIKEIYKIFKDYLPKKSGNKEDSKIISSYFNNFPKFSNDLYFNLGCSFDKFKNIIAENLQKDKSLDNVEKLYKDFSKLSRDYAEKETLLFEDLKLKQISNALNLKFDSLESIKNTQDKIDSIVLQFFFNKDYEELDKNLEPYFEIIEERNKLIDNLLEKISGTSNLSLKALKKIQPYLLSGYKYTNACQKAGYDLERVTHKFKKLPSMAKAMKEGLVGVNNPRVRKINNQTIKLINELISRKIYFDKVHIELARDLPKTKREKIEESESNKAVEKLKDAARDILGGDNNSKDITKARLLIEQHENCPYCDNKLRVSEIKSYQIDHIKPIHRSFDNTFSNKVLVHLECNANKGPNLPLEWLKGDRAENYKNKIESIFKHLGKTKFNNLLKTEIKEEDLENPRILTETRYASRFLKNYIEKHLDFDSFSNKDLKQRVSTRNGSVTNILRNFWHIGEQDSNDNSESINRYNKNRNIHTHHAEDAIILAFSTQSLVQRIHTLSSKNTSAKANESINIQTGNITTTLANVSAKNEAIKDEINRVLHNQAPLLDMQRKVKEAISNIFPSRAVTRLKKYGQIHDDKIYSVRDKSKDYKKLIQDEIKERIKNKDIENLVVIKNQRIDNEKAMKNLEKMIGKDSRNKGLYKCIKDYLENDKNDKCLNNGVEVKSFKIEDKFTPNVTFVRDGVADNSRHQKFLIYKKDGFYHIGVVYFGDNIIDDKNAIVQIVDQDKDYEYRDYSNNGYTYQMTLYKNDLIYYEQENKSNKDGFVRKIYYIDKFDQSKENAVMHLKDPVILKVDKKKNKELPALSKRINGKLSKNNIIKLERLEVDMLGNVYRIQNGEKVNFTKEALEIIKSQVKE